MNSSFPVYHPCKTIKDSQGNQIHVEGNVDDEQIICTTCFKSFTFWIDLIKSHICPKRGIEQLCKCKHKKGWHHAKQKWQDKTLVCFGIGCTCEAFSTLGEGRQ